MLSPNSLFSLHLTILFLLRTRKSAETDISSMVAFPNCDYIMLACFLILLLKLINHPILWNISSCWYHCIHQRPTSWCIWGRLHFFCFRFVFGIMCFWKLFLWLKRHWRWLCISLSKLLCWESSSTRVNMCLWRKAQCVKKCVSTLYCNPCSCQRISDILMTESYSTGYLD